LNDKTAGVHRGARKHGSHLAARGARTAAHFTVPLLQGLKETGYVEGQNVAVEYQYAENQIDRLPALAADLVRRRVTVIVANGGLAMLAAKAATPTIPIVFLTGSDPIASGLVASLNRPGANLTGITLLSAELAPKQLQLLHELIPNAARFGALADPAARMIQSVIPDLQAAARTLGLQQLIVVNAGNDGELETAFATFSQQRVSAIRVEKCGLPGTIPTCRGMGPRCISRTSAPTARLQSHVPLRAA